MRLLAAALASLILVAGPAHAATTVPAGVAIPVALVGALSARDAKAGDAFHFRTTAEVSAGSVTIPAGTPGTGVIAEAAPGRHGMKDSKLVLAPQALQPAGGEAIPVTLPAQRDGALHRRQRAHVFPVPFVAGGLLFVGGLVNPAKDVMLADGTAFTVVTSTQAPAR